jgi:superfamily II DNA or RNA helicase
MIFKPHDYQEDALIRLEKCQRLALWLPMGAGKTSIMLHHIAALQKRFLIVAPTSVMSSTWQNEALKFDTLKHLTFETLHGKDKEHLYLNSKASCFLINYEGLPWLYDTIKKHKKIRFRGMVFDESSALKSPSTVRFKKVRHLAAKVDYVYLLSATPAPNSALDLWSQYYLLDQGLRLGKSFRNYRDKYFNEQGYTFKKYTIKPGAWEEITSAVADVTFRIDDSQLTTKNNLNTVKVAFKLTQSVKEHYDELKDKLVLELRDTLITAVNSAVLTSKLRQFVSGFLYDDGAAPHKIHDLRYQRLVKLLGGELSDKNTLIAYNFKYELAALQHFIPDLVHLDSRHMDRNSIIEAWNAGKIRYLACNPASVSHGLNLQAGGHTIVWLSLTFSLEKYQQLIGRLNRQGQLHSVTNYVLVASNTIDDYIFRALISKKNVQDVFLNFLYDLQKNYLH